ncbi:hypothetical protein BU23DRAFT_604854 [Bimuria novae-zelandiae CBS 107.79]|uniref:Uncharacterized protein n=1 Tax=Bimuria novae-zelandiae CBS 107.79 TaxID=1447943 RepID=A0A6A5UJ49_9PLEO|nr:hypothetical protein BU23DRAFT_604854 [Bimuria novae-zelandiae CBS 107.79]
MAARQVPGPPPTSLPPPVLEQYHRLLESQKAEEVEFNIRVDRARGQLFEKHVDQQRQFWTSLPQAAALAGTVASQRGGTHSHTPSASRPAVPVACQSGAHPTAAPSASSVQTNASSPSMPQQVPQRALNRLPPAAATTQMTPGQAGQQRATPRPLQPKPPANASRQGPTRSMPTPSIGATRPQNAAQNASQPQVQLLDPNGTQRKPVAKAPPKPKAQPKKKAPAQKQAIEVVDLFSSSEEDIPLAQVRGKAAGRTAPTAASSSQQDPKIPSASLRAFGNSSQTIPPFIKEEHPSDRQATSSSILPVPHGGFQPNRSLPTHGLPLSPISVQSNLSNLRNHARLSGTVTPPPHPPPARPREDVTMEDAPATAPAPARAPERRSAHYSFTAEHMPEVVVEGLSYFEKHASDDEYSERENEARTWYHNKKENYMDTLRKQGLSGGEVAQWKKFHREEKERRVRKRDGMVGEAPDRPDRQSERPNACFREDTMDVDSRTGGAPVPLNARRDASNDRMRAQQRPQQAHVSNVDAHGEEPRPSTPTPAPSRSYPSPSLSTQQMPTRTPPSTPFKVPQLPTRDSTTTPRTPPPTPARSSIAPRTPTRTPSLAPPTTPRTPVPTLTPQTSSVRKRKPTTINVSDDSDFEPSSDDDVPLIQRTQKTSVKKPKLTPSVQVPRAAVRGTPGGKNPYGLKNIGR